MSTLSEPQPETESNDQHQEEEPDYSTPPEPIQGDAITQRLIRENIWRPAVKGDDWRVFVIVGREGMGKSLTCASILAACDPEFDHTSAHFDPVNFLEDIAQKQDRPGVGVMSDEAGVGFGNRTWHDREQVEANQAMQTARDDNRIVGLTLPRLEELDKQLQGRIHVLLEVVNKKDGDWVEVKWKNVDPSRSGQDTIYQKYPRVWQGGRKRKVTRVRIGLPPEDFVEPYQQKKAEWKEGLFDNVIERYEGESEDSDDTSEWSPKEIAQDILDNNDVETFIGDNNGQKYISKDKIAVKYEIGDRKTKKVKTALEMEGVDADEY